MLVCAVNGDVVHPIHPGGVLRVPPTLRVVLFVESFSTRSALRGIITDHFRADLLSVFSVYFLRHRLRTLDPDLVILDRDAQRHLRQRSGQFPGWDRKQWERSYWILLGNSSRGLRLPSRQTFCLDDAPPPRDVISAIETSAEELGYRVSQGKIRERYVREPFHVILSREARYRAQGYTTGINENGCGVRVQHCRSEIEQQNVYDVAFRDPGCMIHGNAKGEILEVAESWVNDCRSFLRIQFIGGEFTGDSRARYILEKLIEQQDDQSVRR